MGSSSGRKSGSSGRSTKRKRVVIGADETVRVRYRQDEPQVEAERRPTSRQVRPAAGSRSGSQSRASKQAKRVSAAKKLERERRQRSIKLRQGARYAAVAVTVFLLIFGCTALYNAPVLPVKNVEVQGAERLDRQAVIALAKIPSDATLLRLSPGAIERRLSASPWISSARVERSLPGTVRLLISERSAAAIFDAGGTNVWLVSSDGRFLGRPTAADEGMVVIRDVDGVKPAVGSRITSPELLNAIKVITGVSPELRELVKVVSAPTVDKTVLITSDDVEVFVGEAVQLAAKDRITREILEKKRGEVVYINVRVVESPIWRGLNENR